jgi:L-ascorbate metabolism protein UlaG (beta-lactamase superfamily)
MSPFAFRPRPEHRPRATGNPQGLRLRWLGTAGHVLEGAGVTLLFDPFLTRSGLLTTALRRLRPTPERWRQHLPSRVDAVLVGHSHYDHLLDAPTIARETGALLVGSRSAMQFARAEGVPEAQLREVPPQGSTFSVGAATVRFVPSLHGLIVAGRVPFPGTVDAPPAVPARVWHYRMGGAFGVHVTLGGRSVYHNGSANLVDAELQGLSADVVLLGLAGRRGTRDYVRRVLGTLRPGLVVPTHHDSFFSPLEDGVRLLPGIDLQGFERDLAMLSAPPALRTPTYDDVLVVPTQGSLAEAAVVDR